MEYNNHRNAGCDLDKAEFSASQKALRAGEIQLLNSELKMLQIENEETKADFEVL